MLFSNNFTNLEFQYDFEINLVKFGKQLNAPIFRHAFIKYPNGLFSLAESPKQAKNKEELFKKAKDKNYILDESKILTVDKQHWSPNDWEVPGKNYKLVLEKINSKLKIDKVELYFNTKEEVILSIIISYITL